MTAPSSTEPLILPQRLTFAEPASRLYATNPFDPTWIALEKAAAGSAYIPEEGPWAMGGGAATRNQKGIAERISMTAGVAQFHFAQGIVGTPAERAVYVGLILYILWDEFGAELQKIIDEDATGVRFWGDFAERCGGYLGHPGLVVAEPRHLLSLMYQARRTWYFAATKIPGGSPSTVAARAAIWQANWGSDVCAYAGGLYRHMDEIPVLITGETGTGKDLAAQCIGWSRYIPFDPDTRRFARRYAEDFHVRNLCEVSPELLPSALFGHRKGSFTGATADTPGCLSLPKAFGSLFLDEIGELPLPVQAQLLRPFQNREYVPLGDNQPRPMEGRLIFATHRDLEALCREGKFRPDLLERINGVHVHMPSLRRILDEAPGELGGYVRGFVASKLDGGERVEEWTDRIVNSIHAKRADHPWSRNLRELKNYTERFILTDGPMSAPETSAPPVQPAPTKPQKTAETPSPRPAGGPGAPESTCLPSSGLFGPNAKAGKVTVDELTEAYVKRVYGLTNQNKAETARLTGMDWRTVSRWLDRLLKGKK